MLGSKNSYKALLDKIDNEYSLFSIWLGIN